MKITNVSYERLELQLLEPYTIAYETVSTATNFILRLETDGSLVGYGCSAPDPLLTGMTETEAEDTIKRIVLPFLKGKDPFRYVRILEDLRDLVVTSRSVLAMVDMALLDLVSKKAGVPLYQFLGGYREGIATSITIGIMPIDRVLEKSQEFVSQGFQILKVKGGVCVEEDIEKMLKIRRIFPDVILRFDGNQGYSVEESFAFVEKTKKARIEIFEQPTKTSNEKHLGQVTREVPIPVMADESIKTLADTFRLARNERIDMINIKLMKVGGIMEALHINSVARSANLEAMVGCIDECSLGISAGLHFALSRPNVHYADLDGHLDMINDPFKGLFRLENGILYPTEEPGLGIR
jgi:L-alanine-DL-glutamate epimerase-like enolase superfamily enzyme